MSASATLLRIRTPLALALGALASGCGLSQSYPHKSTFALQAGPPQVAAGRPAATQAVRLQAMRMAKPYDGTAFIYRTGASRLEADYYNAFIVVPDSMLAGDLARWLDAAGVFPAVVEPGGLASYGYSLETALTCLYGDYTDRKAPKAVIEIKAYLLEEQPAGSIVSFQKIYSESEPIAADAPEALVAGWERAYRRILLALATDLRAKLTQDVVQSAPPQK